MESKKSFNQYIKESLAMLAEAKKEAGLSKEETLVVAQKFADAMSKIDTAKVTVNKRTLEEDSFDLDVNGEEFDGGSYIIYQNGDVMNAAVPGNPVYGKKNDSIDTIAKNMKKMIGESAVTEGIVTLKRRYTENHPAVTVGKNAAIRNKVLEAIKDGKISQEEFDTIVSELSNDSKRWTRTNSKYFSVSEEGVSLSKFGRKVLNSVTVNEATTKNPEIWVPGGFDKEVSKIPNQKIDVATITKIAKKYDVDIDDAIAYVEYGWDIDLTENTNTNTNMKTKFIYESFGDFVNSLNEATITLDATDPKDKNLLKLLKKHKVSMKNLGEGPNGFDEVELTGSKKDLMFVISDENDGWDDPDLEEYIEESNGTHSITVRSLNEAFASAKLASILTGGNKMDKDLPSAFYNMSKLSLDKIQDIDIIEMTPEQAKKEKRASAVYMYFTTNEKENPYAGKSAFNTEKNIPGNTLLAITDGSNEWMATGWQRSYTGDKKASRTLKITKRDDSDGFAKSSSGNSNGSGISSMKQVVDLADRAYCLDLTVLKARYSTEAQRAERTEAKKGATAFMNDKDFKASNKARYNEILSTKASAMPMDSIVLGAIDALSAQIKDAISSGEKGRYGDILIGTDQRGKEVKLSDASSLMRNILDEYSRYCGSVSQNEQEKAAGYGGNYYEGAMKQQAKTITDYVKKIETKSYGW